MHCNMQTCFHFTNLNFNSISYYIDLSIFSIKNIVFLTPTTLAFNGKISCHFKVKPQKYFFFSKVKHSVYNLKLKENLFSNSTWAELKFRLKFLLRVILNCVKTKSYRHI